MFKIRCQAEILWIIQEVKVKLELITDNHKSRFWAHYDVFPLDFSGENEDYFLVVLLLLIVLGTILVTLLLFFLCKR